MSNNKQKFNSTHEFNSVEWLYHKMIIKLSNELQTTQYLHFFVDELKQAKAMHKEEIKDAVGVGSQFDRDYLYGYHDKAEQYYNETFNNETV